MIDINQIKQGETFWECQSGFNEEYVALEDGHRHDGGWAILGRGIDGEETQFFSRDGYGAYAPRLYRQPEYI